MAPGKILVAQGGGPTAVINQSLVGVALEARRFGNIERIYGARHGVRGIVNEDFVDLTQETHHNLELVAGTPASALGSTRDKPDARYCHEIFEVLRSHAIEHFFYPGFTAASGGLLRERSLVTRRDAFADSPAQREFLERLGVAAGRDERLLTLFCYPDAPLAEWFDALAGGTRTHCVLVPRGTAEEAIAAFFGASPRHGESLRRGALRVQRIPFLSHDDYDRLLWSADLNFVRGEDSWIRAHWAARPFVWQPYVQAGQAHHVKLQAFLGRLDAGPVVDTMMRAWSGAGAIGPAWTAFEAALPALVPAYRAWSSSLAAQADLATRLVEFCADRL